MTDLHNPTGACRWCKQKVQATLQRDVDGLYLKLVRHRHSNKNCFGSYDEVELEKAWRHHLQGLTWQGQAER